MSDLQGYKVQPHHAVVPVPQDFAKVVREEAAKNKVLFADQLLSFAMAGAECLRLHRNK